MTFTTNPSHQESNINHHTKHVLAIYTMSTPTPRKQHSAAGSEYTKVRFTPKGIAVKDLLDKHYNAYWVHKWVDNPTVEGIMLQTGLGFAVVQDAILCQAILCKNANQKKSKGGVYSLTYHTIQYLQTKMNRKENNGDELYEGAGNEKGKSIKQPLILLATSRKPPTHPIHAPHSVPSSSYGNLGLPSVLSLGASRASSRRHSQC